MNDPADRRPTSRFALLLGFRRPIDRPTYIAGIIALLAFRYAIDAMLVAWFSGKVLDPLAYFTPLTDVRLAGVPPADWYSAFWLFVGSTLPFVCIGVSFSCRRASDAGLHPLVGLLFLVPVLNYLTIVLLGVLPTHEADATPTSDARGSELASLLFSAAAGAAIGVIMMVFSVLWLNSYGATLFVGTPFVIGCVTGFLYTRGDARSGWGAAIGASQLALLLVGGALLAFALEGAVCIAMVYPLAAVMAAVGALLGASVAPEPAARLAHIALVVLSWPVLTGVEAVRHHTPVREVVSAIEIDAPPAAVWPYVIRFSELPPPGEWVFRLGIAYPQRARIDGHGVGAVRHCEFSTGAFVEPITHWEEPVRLSFDVTSQPRPMHEWSPYRHVNAPHLVDTMRSRRGEFRLVPLSGGRTRLEGSTWYEIELFPQIYWTRWSDALIHAIHGRVLAHIKRGVEGGATSL
jgi:hypothetical protein